MLKCCVSLMKSHWRVIRVLERPLSKLGAISIGSAYTKTRSSFTTPAMLIRWMGNFAAHLSSPITSPASYGRALLMGND